MANRLDARGWGSRLGSSPLATYAAAGLLVAGVTVVIGLLGDLHLANASMLYLVAVLVSAVALGRGPAVFSAVLAFLTFNFFQTEPRFTLIVADPDEWIVLVLFLVTAVVTGALAAGQRARADEAEEHRRQAQALYDIAVAAADPDLGSALDAVAERLRVELGAAAIEIAVHAGPDRRLAPAARVGDAEALTSIGMRQSGPLEVLSPALAGADPPGRWMRVSQPHGARATRSTPFRIARAPIRGGVDEIGEILLAMAPGVSLDAHAARVVTAVAAHVSVAVERAWLRDDATEAEILRRSDDAKSALLDAVSHDLRTPLASIIASAGSLRQTGVDWTAEERAAFALAIEQEARRLDRIVGNLLDFSRVRAGAIHAERAWYEPVALVREVLGRLAPVTADHELRVDLPDELPPVPMDYSKVDQVLTNLVENAVKYSPPGSEIRVSASMDEGALRVSVEDAGPGIEPAALGRIFEPFYQIGGARRRGSGLGLAVASGLVEAHGGRIWVEPISGGGSRFVFTIPAEEGDSP